MLSGLTRFRVLHQSRASVRPSVGHPLDATNEGRTRRGSSERTSKWLALIRS